MKLILICFTLLLSSIICQLERDRSIIIKDPFYRDPFFFPAEILEEFSHYTSLMEKDADELCNLISLFEAYPNNIEDRFKEKNCIPDHHTLRFLLEEGHIELVGKMIVDTYLPNEIDPTEIVNSWIGKTNTLVKRIEQTIEQKNYLPLTPKYSYMNYDNNVSIVIKLSEEFLLSNKVDVFCIKDLLVVNSSFFKKGKYYYIRDRKKLFDEVDGECESTYNSYSSELEIRVNKKNKMKVWDSLFKRLN